jgi:hypothetical protein
MRVSIVIQVLKASKVQITCTLRCPRSEQNLQIQLAGAIRPVVIARRRFWVWLDEG